jgi:chemosensory pili system protein ChpC
VTEEVEELYSLLVPLTDMRLIVPRVCVAEVTGLGQLKMLADAPDWLVGMVGWNEISLPLVSFEAAAGSQSPEIGGRTRAVIFHAASDLKGGYFAIMSQGLPQLVRINRSVVESDESEDLPDSAPMICRIRMVNEYPIVPDLDRLEVMLGDVSDIWA